MREPSDLIYNISPHRSATKSVTAFAKAHGVGAMHWPGDAFDAAAESGDLWQMAMGLLDPSIRLYSDLPWPMLYRRLAERFRSARFILVKREPSVWLRSVRGHTDGRDLSHLERAFYRWLLRKELLRRELSLLRLDVTDEELLKARAEFFSEARSALGNRLAEFHLNDRDLGPKLASVLGVKYSQPFPHVAEGK